MVHLTIFSMHCSQRCWQDAVLARGALLSSPHSEQHSRASAHIQTFAIPVYNVSHRELFLLPPALARRLSITGRGDTTRGRRRPVFRPRTRAAARAPCRTARVAASCSSLDVVQGEQPAGRGARKQPLARHNCGGAVAAPALVGVGHAAAAAAAAAHERRRSRAHTRMHTHAQARACCGGKCVIHTHTHTHTHAQTDTPERARAHPCASTRMCVTGIPCAAVPSSTVPPPSITRVTYGCRRSAGRRSSENHAADR